MATRGIGGRWVEQGLVGNPTCHGFGEGVVDLEDGFFGAVVAVVFGFVFAFDDGEGVHDIGHGMAGRGEGAGEGFGLLTPFVLDAEVEVEEGGVQLAAQQEAPTLVPPERRAGPAAVLREGLKVPGGVGEFENAGEEPVAEGWWIVDGGLRMKSPWTGRGVGGGRENGELLDDEVAEVRSADLLPCRIVVGEGVHACGENSGKRCVCFGKAKCPASVSHAYFGNDAGQNRSLVGCVRDFASDNGPVILDASSLERICDICCGNPVTRFPPKVRIRKLL